MAVEFLISSLIGCRLSHLVGFDEERSEGFEGVEDVLQVQPGGVFTEVHRQRPLLFLDGREHLL